jgi:hypothetical protein
MLIENDGWLTVCICHNIGGKLVLCIRSFLHSAWSLVEPNFFVWPSWSKCFPFVHNHKCEKNCCVLFAILYGFTYTHTAACSKRTNKPLITFFELYFLLSCYLSDHTYYFHRRMLGIFVEWLIFCNLQLMNEHED